MLKSLDHFLLKFFTPLNTLLIALFVYLLVLSQTFLFSFYPAGVDASTHLFQIGLIAKEGFTAWNHWWYAGHPLLDQYPPIPHTIGALFSYVIGIENAYKLVAALAFLLLPLSFYLLLHEFNLNEKQKAIALLLFSFSPVFTYYLQGGVFSALFSIPFFILFFKYFIRSMGQKKICLGDISLASIFLAISALSHLFVPVASIFFSLIYLISFSRSARSVRRFIAISFISCLLVSFFWVPILLNYTFKGESPGIQTIFGALFSVLAPFGRAFAVYVNFLSIATIILISFLFLLSIRKDLSFIFGYNQNFKLRAAGIHNSLNGSINFSIFFFLVISLVAVWVLFLPHSGQASGKLPLFLPIFFSLFLCRYMENSKSITVLLYLLAILFFLNVLTIETSKIPAETVSMANWASSQTQSRALYLPQGFGLALNYPTKPNFESYLYDVYLPPIYFQKENYWGWFGEAAPRSVVNDPITFVCTRPQSLSEIGQKISFNSKIIFQTMQTCTIKSPSEEFCSVVQKGAVDHVFVNLNFPEVTEYVKDSSCLKKEGEFQKLVSYRVLSPHAYVSGNNIYSKKSGSIEIIITNSTSDLIIKESYYPGWKAYLDGEKIEISEDEDGFIRVMGLPLSDSLNRKLVLIYSPDKLYNIPFFISILSWVVFLPLVVFPKYIEKFVCVSYLD